MKRRASSESCITTQWPMPAVKRATSIISRRPMTVRHGRPPRRLLGQPIDHLGPPHFLGSAPRIEIPVTFECKTVLLDAHVTHLHFSDELVDRQSFRAL